MGGKNKTTEKSSKSSGDKTSKGKGSGSKDDKAAESNNSKLKPATAINARHILVCLPPVPDSSLSQSV